MKDLISNIKKHPYLKYLANKYVITLLVFAVWVTFFGSNNLLSQRQLRQQLHEHRAERAYYRTEIERNRQNIFLLENDLEHLERIAREQFLMKRDNEDIFIFIEQ